MMQTTGDRAAGSVPGTNAQKVRVYEMAKDVGLSNKDLVDKIRALGIEVKNHMSALDPDDVARVRRALEKERQENTVIERIQPTVIRRRNKGGPEGVEAPRTAAAPARRDAVVSRRAAEPTFELPHRGPKPPPVEPEPQPEVEEAPVAAAPEPVLHEEPEPEPPPPPVVVREEPKPAPP